MSKRLGGNIIGCKNKTSSWYLIGFPDDGSNMGSTVSCRGGPHVVMYNHSPYYTKHKYKKHDEPGYGSVLLHRV